MSYIRWSTPIKKECPTCGRFEVIRDKDESDVAFYLRVHKYDMDLAKLNDGLCKDCISPWYIYHDCSSGDDLDSQMLAIWSNSSHDQHGLFDYETVKYMIDNNDYSALSGFADVGDPENCMSDALKEWLEEMVIDFKETKS